LQFLETVVDQADAARSPAKPSLSAEMRINYEYLNAARLRHRRPILDVLRTHETELSADAMPFSVRTDGQWPCQERDHNSIQRVKSLFCNRHVIGNLRDAAQADRLTAQSVSVQQNGILRVNDAIYPRERALRLPKDNIGYHADICQF